MQLSSGILSRGNYMTGFWSRVGMVLIGYVFLVATAAPAQESLPGGGGPTPPPVLGGEPTVPDHAQGDQHKKTQGKKKQQGKKSKKKKRARNR